MKIRNFVKINGQYVCLDELPEEQRSIVTQAILDRLSEGFGYKKEREKAV